MMDKTKQPGISFDGIILVQENFWRDYDVPDKTRVVLNINTNYSQNESNQSSVEMTVDINLATEEKEVFKLSAKFVGFFSIMKDHENMDMQDYLENNAPALMFPYIREQISTVSQRAGIKPILLPPLNVIALIKEGRDAQPPVSSEQGDQ